MEDTYFVTITGLNHYYGKNPFEINRVVKLVKEPNNSYDSEAIKAELPYIGTIGYVANSTNTVFKGTVSAGRLYDHIGDYAYAQVLFVTHSSVIALILSPEDIENGKETEEINGSEKVERETTTPREGVKDQKYSLKHFFGFRG